jgi:hypothetical protein
MSDANKIESAAVDTVRITSEREVIPYRGFIESDKIDRFIESVIDDLIRLSSGLNGHAAAIRQFTHLLQLENREVKSRAVAVEKQLEMDRRVRARRGERLGRWHDFHDASNVFWLDEAEAAKRAAVSTSYGQVTVPMNAVESRTYSLRLLSGGVVTPSSVKVTTSGLFDKLEGDGTVDYEYDGTVEETDPRNAVNGNNDNYWRRRVVFDLDSDVSEVEVEITVQIPDSANLYANVVYLHPYPVGGVDVTGVWVSPDLSDSFTPIDGFDELHGARKSRWFLSSQKVSKIKVRLRQRNWFEENGKKVFEYGLQELGVQLVEWDKTYAEGGELSDNHTVVVQMDADPGFVFSKLYGFYTDPNFLLEPAGQRHLHFVVATDEEGANEIWNSDSSAPPQSLAAPIDMGSVQTIYVLVTLNWAEEVAVGSPFAAGTTPFLYGFGIDCTYVDGV